MKWRLFVLLFVLLFLVLALAGFAPAPEPIVIDAGLLSSLVGVALSLAFAYIPGVEDWFNQLMGKQKAAVMALLLILASIAIFVIGCFGVMPISIACTKQGVFEFLQILIAALIANQSTYVLAVKPFKV